MSRPPAQVSGFTLVELVVTMAVVAILASMAVPSFRNMMAQSEMRAVSTALSLSMTRARSEATKRSATITVARKSGQWTSGWEIKDPANVVVAEQGPVTHVTFSSAPASVVYLSSGRVRGNPDDNEFTLTSTRLASVVRCVSVDARGAPTIKEEACS